MAQITCPRCGSPENYENGREESAISVRISYTCVECGNGYFVSQYPKKRQEESEEEYE